MVMSFQITADDLYDRYMRAEVNILDVRNQAEYDESHIPGALKIQAGQIPNYLGQVPTDKPVVVHCLGGDRSSVAASYLQRQGFDSVINLTGGIRCWWERDYPLVRAGEPELIPTLS